MFLRVIYEEKHSGLVTGTDPWIRVRIKMSRIPNTGSKGDGLLRKNINPCQSKF
jgi:hypothetical protein